MLWLITAIISYFLLAIVFLLDKYLLVQRIPDPKVYAFYIGLISILTVFLIPFVGFEVPELKVVLLSLVTGVVFILALFYFFKALRAFEASRIVPAVGGILPLFTLVFVYFISGGEEVLSLPDFSAFLLLILGTVLITYRQDKGLSTQSLKLSFLAAFLFALYFILLKYVYLDLSFWSGLIWTRVGAFLAAIFLFLAFLEVRRELLKKTLTFSFKWSSIFGATPFLFVLTRIGAGLAGLFQMWAVFLAPFIGIALINALQGTQYLFLFLITTLVSLRFPGILREEISGPILLQKVLAILLISAGIAILTF